MAYKIYNNITGERDMTAEEITAYNNGKRNASDKLEDIRQLRNEKLSETDWMANSDVTLADNWKTYRQQLRDLPASASPKLSSDGSLDMSSVTFPTKPS